MAHGVLVQAIRNLALPRRIVATLDAGRLYEDHTINVLYMKEGGPDVRLLLAILNSRLMNYWFLKRHIDINIMGVYLEAAPFPKLNLVDPGVRKRHDRAIGLVDAIRGLKMDAAKVKSPHEQTQLQRQVEATGDSIDRLVYELYGLSPDEIKIVEGS